ncbi:hypothetical protein GCM10009087_14930 [Sphingomonas oligophenolica]|uniref:DUF1801 domain-containing protein n=1 Tax=Sphingomonas oligophenolica TaxID=301154 RepID=A0ABU9Y2X8_9SPHN
MTGNKTQATGASVEAFLAKVEPEQRRDDGRIVCAMMTRITGEPATMWGPSIIGFGTRHYRYESGREGDICRIGFSPRRAQLVLYIGAGSGRLDPLLATLGRHSTGKGCLYIRKLADVDQAVLEALIAKAWAHEPAV